MNKIISTRSTIYRPPKPKVHEKYSSIITHKQSNKNARWVGASILLYMIAPDNYVFFVLGQETFHPGYKDSNKWSDFGGGASQSENEYICAAREFLEETNYSINPYPSKFGVGGIPSVSSIAHELKKKEYTARIDFDFTDTKTPKTYTTFLIEIPWDPTIGFHFAKKQGKIQTQSESHLVVPSSSSKYQHFQTRRRQKKYRKKKISNECQEKSNIQLFSIPTLLQNISCKLRKHLIPCSATECTKQQHSHSPEPQFRHFFLQRMIHILHTIFPRNVVMYQSLNTVSTFQCLQSQTPSSLPPPVSSSSGTWNRGLEVPMHVSRKQSQQPPHQMFRNFNTRRKKSSKPSKRTVFIH